MYRPSPKVSAAVLFTLAIVIFLIFKLGVDENYVMAKQTWRQQNLISEESFAGCGSEDEACFGNSLAAVNFFSSALDIQHYSKIKRIFCKEMTVECGHKFDLLFWNQFKIEKLNFPKNPDWEDKIEIVFNLKQLSDFLQIQSNKLKNQSQNKKDLAAKIKEKIEDIQSEIAIYYPRWLTWYECIKLSKTKTEAKVCLNEQR